jgi:hypothetical protein
MTKKTRLIILIFCVASFFIASPILVAYSMGYRFDLEKLEVTATGGIYVRTFPAADQITIDSKTSDKPGMFGNSIFIQSLLPKNHTVFIQKAGYFDYSKTLSVKENQVTKLENVLLFKKSVSFEFIIDPLMQVGKANYPFNLQDKYVIKNSNLYYSTLPENATLTVTQKNTPLIKKIAAFTLQSNNILWLGTDGFLYQSDLNNLATEPIKLTTTPIKETKIGVYKIITDSKNTFVNNNGSLLILDTKMFDLKNLKDNITDAKISPDGYNLVYSSAGKIYLYTLSADPNRNYLEPKKTTLLYDSKDAVNDFVWLNNDYVITSSADKITISEIDYRGNINTISLPATATTTTKTIEIKNPKILFNQQWGRLFISTGSTLLLTEKLVP